MEFVSDAVSEVVSMQMQACQNILAEKVKVIVEKNKELEKLNMKVKEFQAVHEELKKFLEKQTTCQKCEKKFEAGIDPYILSCNHVVCGICLTIDTIDKKKEKKEKKDPIDIEALYIEFANIADEIRLASEEVENKKQILDDAEKENDLATKVCPSAVDILAAKADISFRQEAKIAQQKRIEEIEQKCQRREVSEQTLEYAEKAFNTAIDKLKRLKNLLTKKDKNIKQISTTDWYTKKCPICHDTVKALILNKFISEYNAFESELKDKYLKIEREMPLSLRFGKNRNSKKSVRKNMKKSVRKSVRKTKNLRKSAVKSTKKKSTKKKSRKTRKSIRR